MDTILSIEIIATNPAVRDGRPYIMGTTLTVADIAILKNYQMLTPDEIADHYEISLDQVYAALAYYYAHKAEIDQSIQDRRKLAEEMRAKRVGSRHTPLFG